MAQFGSALQSKVHINLFRQPSTWDVGIAGVTDLNMQDLDQVFVYVPVLHHNYDPASLK